MASKVTAFELDAATVGDTDAHPFTFGGFPGRWQVGRPMLPAALGMTVTRMRELIEQFNLPLVEVQVAPKEAYETFPEDPQRILSGSMTPEVYARTTDEDGQPEQAPLLEVNGELVPGPVQGGQHPPLQPFAAAMIARDTARLYPGDDPEAIVEDLPVEPDTAAEEAAREAAGGDS